MVFETINSQEMFMLLFSILYGIMLNSLIGLGAFPIGHALEGVDVKYRVKSKDECMPCGPKFGGGTKSRNRVFLSLLLFNFGPFIHFAIAFQLIGVIGDIKVYDISNVLGFWFTIFQIVILGFLSLSVFAYPQFFFGFITSSYGNLFYTQYDRERIMNERAIHPHSRNHFFAGVLYLIPFGLLVAVLYLLLISMDDSNYPTAG